MRLVQVTVPTGKRQAVLSTLDDEGIDYVVTEETSGREYTAVVTFPLPTGAVESVLDSLREVGLDEDAYTVVLDAETVVSRRFDALTAKYEESDEDNGQRIARDELRTAAAELAPPLPTYMALTFISAIVATVGVLLDSAAVVVGSMVIAPLIGPAMSASVATVVNDNDLFAEGVKLQLVGGAVAAVGAAGFAVFVRATNLVAPGLDPLSIGQVAGRLSPDFLSLAVALGAGAAGALSLSAGTSMALVGVMIAAALVPPFGVIGVGVAWGQPVTVINSSVLVLVNLLSINLAALLVFWYQGYRPDEWLAGTTARRNTTSRVVTLVAAIVLLSVFLGGITYDSYQTAQFNENVREDVQQTLNTTEGNLTVLEFQVEHRRTIPFQRPATVVVTVGHPPGTDPPRIADLVAARVAEHLEPPLGLGLFPTPEGVPVQVRYVQIDTANTPVANGTAPSPNPSIATRASGFEPVPASSWTGSRHPGREPLTATDPSPSRSGTSAAGSSTSGRSG